MGKAISTPITPVTITPKAIVTETGNPKLADNQPAE